MAVKNRKTVPASPAAAAPSVPWIETLPRWGLPVLLAGLALLFFIPFLLSKDMIYGSDAINGVYTRYFYAEYLLQNKAFPWWMPVTLSGMPTLDAFFGDMFYPLALLQFIMSVPKALGCKYLVTVMLAGVFMFLFLRGALFLGRGAAFLGALCFMFNTEFISHMFPGHDGKMFVISLLPLSLYSLKRMLDMRSLRFAALLSLSIGLCLLTSHVQTTYFSLWGLFFYFLFETARGYLADRLKRPALIRGGLFVLAVTLGMGVGMVQFLPPYQFTKQYSVRGEGEKTSYEHAISWSLHPEEAASLIVPEFCGFADKDDAAGNKVYYWGRNPFKLNNEYAGIVVLVLSVFFIVIFRKDRFVLFWACAALGALVFALGGNTPFFYLFYYLVPGVKLFRAPSMIMFWFSLALSVIAAYGLNRLVTEPAPKGALYSKRLMIALAALAGLTLLVSVAKDTVFSLWKGILYTAITDRNSQAFNANYGSFIKGSWFALLFGGSSLLLVGLYLKDSLKKETLLWLLALAALADLFRVDAYFYKLVPPDQVINRSEPVMKDLAARSKSEKFRVLPVPGHLGQNDAQLYGLESVLGFHDNELRWYRDFTGGQTRDNLIYRLREGRIDGNPFLDLLNVRYVLFRPGQNMPLRAEENPGGRERAWIASGYEVAPEGAVLGRLRSDGFPYKNRVILDKPPPGFVQTDTLPGPAGRVARIDYAGNRRTYEADMARPGFLMLSEPYLPYWKAFEGGRELEVYRTDYALMSVPLPAGKHVVVMEYKSPYIRIGAWITFFSLLICLALFLVSWRLSRPVLTTPSK